MVRAGDWVLEQMSIYIFNVGPAVHVYIGVYVCEGKKVMDVMSVKEARVERERNGMRVESHSEDLTSDARLTPRK